MILRILRTLLPWLALAAIGGVAAWLRYDLIESRTLAQMCGDAASPWWCTWRHWLVLGFLYNVYGVAALIAALVALFSHRLRLAWLASALGLFALVLYCFQSGAVALLVGALRLLRAQAPATAPPIMQDRPREHDIQRQP